MGSGILVRAVVQGYRQALKHASKNGVANEAMQNVVRKGKAMTEQEARQILGVTEGTPWEERLKRYDDIFMSRKCISKQKSPSQGDDPEFRV